MMKNLRLWVQFFVAFALLFGTAHADDASFKTAPVTVQISTPGIKWSKETQTILDLSKKDQVTAIAGKKLDIETLVALIYHRNPGLQAERKRWEASLQQYSQLEALKETLSVYGQFLDKPSGMGGSKTMIEQQFPWPGVMTLQNDIVTTMVEEAGINYEIRLRDLWISAQETYYRTQFTLDRLKLVKENVQLLEDLHQTVSALYSTDRSTLSDLLLVEIQMEELNLEELTLLDHLDVFRVTLNSLMDFPDDAKWKWIVEHHMEGETYGQIYRQEVSENHLELRRLRFREQRLQYLTALEENIISPNLSPNFAITNPIQDIYRERDETIPERPQPAPFFGKRDEYLKEIKLKKVAIEQDVLLLRNDLSAWIRDVVFRINEHQRDALSYQMQIIPKAKEAIDATISEYQVGRNELINVLRAQETLLRFETKFHKAHQLAQEQKLQLKKLLGLPLYEKHEHSISDTQYPAPVLIHKKEIRIPH